MRRGDRAAAPIERTTVVAAVVGNLAELRAWLDQVEALGVDLAAVLVDRRHELDATTTLRLELIVAAAGDELLLEARAN